MDGAMTNFDNWWDEDDLRTQGNNFEYGTPAFWAWEAWGAGARAEREACKQIIRETPFSNWFQADLIEAIDKRGQALCDLAEDGVCETLDCPNHPIEQEPVAWQWLGSAHFRKKLPKNADITAWNPLYTTPPQRTWVGLTDKDWNRSKHNYDFQKGVDWAESILKQKNGYAEEKNT